MKPKGSDLAPVREGHILNLEKFRVKKRLEDCGLEWHEDTSGKVRIWIRLRDEGQPPVATETRPKVIEFKPEN